MLAQGMKAKRRSLMMTTKKRNQRTPEPFSDDSERDRFGRLVKKLVNVPKREIDEKAREWEKRKGAS
jgi:hypothetical protein